MFQNTKVGNLQHFGSDSLPANQSAWGHVSNFHSEAPASIDESELLPRFLTISDLCSRYGKERTGRQQEGGGWKIRGQKEEEEEEEEEVSGRRKNLRRRRKVQEGGGGGGNLRCRRAHLPPQL